MNVVIGIELTDKNIVKDLFETSQPKAHEEKIIGEGVSIRIGYYFSSDAVDVPTILNIVAYIGEHVALPIAIGILSRYLYDKLKDRKGKTRITINYKPVEIDAEKIEQVILNMLPKEEDE